MQRVSVVGVTGSGKSTFADRLASNLEAGHFELDALNWEDDWQEADPEDFVARVTAATEGDRWVIAGNYSRVQPIIWERADTVVWLDLPFRVVFPRLLRRTVRRARTKETLWGTNNRESFRKALSKDSILWWQLKTFRRVRRNYPQRFSEPRWSHLTVVHLSSDADVRSFLDTTRK